MPRAFAPLPILLAVILVATACGGDGGPLAGLPTAPATAPAVASLSPAPPNPPPVAAKSPAQVVADFYGWYLGYAATANPLVDRAYRARPELSSGFIANLDRVTSGTLMADPVLCAQNIPEEVNSGSATITGDTARVGMTSSFAGHRWTVALTRADGRWLITEVRCAS